MKQLRKNRFYVYCYLDPRKPGQFTYPNLPVSFLYEPFYIGKGTRTRYKHHLYPYNQNYKFNELKQAKINKLQKLGLTPIVIKVVENLLEGEAYELEALFIKEIRRIYDIPPGTLTNIEVSSGKVKKIAIETRLKISKANKGRAVSTELRKRISETMKGMKRSKVYIKMLSDNRKGANNPGARKYIFIDPTGKEYYCDDGFLKFTKEHKLDYSQLRRTLDPNFTIKWGKSFGWRARYND